MVPETKLPNSNFEISKKDEMGSMWLFFTHQLLLEVIRFPLRPTRLVALVCKTDHLGNWRVQRLKQFLLFEFEHLPAIIPNSQWSFSEKFPQRLQKSTTFNWVIVSQSLPIPPTRGRPQRRWGTRPRNVMRCQPTVTRGLAGTLRRVPRGGGWATRYPSAIGKNQSMAPEMQAGTRAGSQKENFVW